MDRTEVMHVGGPPPNGRKRPRSRGNPRTVLLGAAVLVAALAGGGIVYAVTGNDAPAAQQNPATPPTSDVPADDLSAEEQPADEAAADEPASGEAADPDQTGTAQGGGTGQPAANTGNSGNSGNTAKDPAATAPKNPSSTKPKPKPTQAPGDDIDEIDRGNGAGAVEPQGPVGGY